MSSLCFENNDVLSRTGLLFVCCLRCFLFQFIVLVDMDAVNSKLELRSLLKVTDSRFNLTPEEEDARYGPLKEHLYLARLRIASLHGTTFDDVVDNPELDPKDDFVWEGWQATYLSLKKGGVEDYGNKQPDVKRRKICESTLLEKAYVLAGLGCMMLLRTCEYWTELEEVVGKIECDAVKEKVFDCTVKFCLSIWDEEDLERIIYREEIDKEHRKFWREVCVTGEVYEFAIGELEYQFSVLNESDVCQAYVRHKEMLMFEPISSVFIPEEVKKSGLIEQFTPRALRLLKKHRPLKEEFRAQLLMELSLIKCFHVTDVLILEAIHGLQLPEFGEKYSAGLDPENAEKLNILLQNLTEVLYDLIRSLSFTKAEAVRAEDFICMYIMSHMLRGFFKDEVINVVRIACYERRLRNEPFITMSHILTGLSCSRVADCLPELQFPSHRSYSGFFVIELCLLSEGLRCHLGDDTVGLEHFVFAIVYGSLKMDHQAQLRHGSHLVEETRKLPGSDFFQKLKEGCWESHVKSWRNLDVFMTILEKRYRARETVTHHLMLDLMVKLDKDLKSGNVIMPCDDDFRAPPLNLG